MILVVGCRIGLGALSFGVALVTLALAAWASFSFPAYHFVVLTHLHNLVPLIFLWEWSGRIRRPRARLVFRLTQVGWIVVVPLAIMVRRLRPAAGGRARDRRWSASAPGRS